MPHVEIKCYPGRTEEVKQKCADKIAADVAELMGCDISSVSVAIKEVEKLMWGQSSYAVIFCVLRDKFGYGDNATSFENDIMTFSSRLGLQYPCPPTTISSAIYNNPYLKLHVDKWKKRGVKPRSLLLAEAFIQAIEDLQNG